MIFWKEDILVSGIIDNCLPGTGHDQLRAIDGSVNGQHFINKQIWYTGKIKVLIVKIELFVNDRLALQLKLQLKVFRHGAGKDRRAIKG